MARGEVVLYYQPQVDLRSLRTHCAEALLRWDHPVGGVLPPIDFLPALAHTPLMPEITDWAVRTACASASHWSGASVAVNIAAVDAMRDSLVESVQATLDATGLPPGQLTLEITEHSLVHDLDRAMANLLALAGEGVRVALDDFGTGYSSLLYLRELPIDEIKIDRTFVGGIGRNRDDDAIVAALVKLGHSVGVRVVAEGVETKAQAHSLVELGCDAAQGFLFGRPTRTFEPADLRALDPRLRRPVRRRPLAPIANEQAEAAIRPLLSSGASLHTIAAALNRQGIRTTRGTRWTSASVGRAVATL